MKKGHTVFVVGAGASAPYGFPVGGTLLRKLNTSERLIPQEWLRYSGVELEEDAEDKFKHALREASPGSIDEFLQDNQHMLKIGKMLLARLLIQCEDKATLFARPDGGWLHDIWQELKAPPDKFGQNAVTFITYNYDRTIEHFLTTAMHRTYHITPEAAWKAVSKVSIIHPHGQLGAYYPTDGTKFCNATNRSYYNSCTFENVACAANAIRLYWQQEDAQEATRRKIAQRLSDARAIVFLGFGFLDSNLEHILPHIRRGAGGSRMWGTCYGMRQQRLAVVQKLLGKLPSQPNILTNVGCCDLLLDHVPLHEL